jgi:hypothetical protein
MWVRKADVKKIDLTPHPAKKSIKMGENPPPVATRDITPV